jgi:hypothetical protein
MNTATAHTNRSTLTMLVALLLMAGSLLTACGEAIGSGTSATENRTLPAFTRIEVHGEFEVHVLAGAEQVVTVTGDDNLLAAYETVVENETLIISVSDEVWYKVAPMVEIQLPELTGISSHGLGDVLVQDLDSVILLVELAGPADVTLLGQVDRLFIEQTDRGDVWAAELTSREASVDLRGAGSASVSVSQHFEAHISGTGHVDVHGDPQSRDVEVSGYGSVNFR